MTDRIKNKLFFKAAIAVAAIIILSSCGASHYLTTNANLQQTNVVLSQNNFYVVKNVESSVTAKYWFGIGGISKKASLTGSQALVNVTVKYSDRIILCFSEITYRGEATVIEFDKQATKQAKRDEKGKKKQNVEDLM